MTVVLALVVFVLVSGGTYLLLQRTLTRIILGLGLIGHGANLLLQRTLTRIILGLGLIGHGANLLLVTAGGRAGTPAFVGDEGPFSDPLAQAMVLTAIVIGFGMTGLLLTLGYRSWQLNRHDEVEDDLEDRRIARGEHPLSRHDDNGDGDDGNGAVPDAPGGTA